MEDFKKSLNSYWDKNAPAESTFSEHEKQAVWQKIHSKKERKPRYLFPKMLTAAALLAVFFVGINFLKENDSTPNHADDQGIIDTELASYQALEVGDNVNGWEVIEHDVQGDQGPTTLIFKKETVMHGKVSYAANGKLEFRLNESSRSTLPIETADDQPFQFNGSDQDIVKRTFDLNQKENWGDVAIEVNQLEVLINEDVLIGGFSLADYEDEREEILSETAFRLNVNDDFEIELSSEEHQVYEAFANTHDDRELSGLSPAQIFSFYWRAEEQQDIKTQYALFNHSENVEKPFDTLEVYEQTKTDQSYDPLHAYKKNELIEVVVNEENAYIAAKAVDSGEISLGFGLSKNNDGVWKVNWLPLQ